MNKKHLFGAFALTTAIAAGTAPAFSASPAREIIATGQLGNGTVTAWKEGAILGASIDAAALMSLPSQQTIVDLPLKDATPFRLVEIDWNPQGHEPHGVYDVPHFDVHFYVISKQTRDGIPFKEPGSVQKPDSSIVPEGFVTDGTVVPKMGMHYVPQQAPEFNGKPFTCTPLIGYTHEQRFAFVEAMFTQKFTSGKGSCSYAVPSADGIGGVGLPKKIGVSLNESTGDYDIKLTD